MSKEIKKEKTIKPIIKYYKVSEQALNAIVQGLSQIPWNLANPLIKAIEQNFSLIEEKENGDT